MPSPFPGMDPYIESNEWPNFHHWLATEIAGQINPLLGPNYVAIVEKRMILADYPLEEENRQIRYPDVSVVREPQVGYRASAVADPPVVLSVPTPKPRTVEDPYLWVEVITVKDHELVTSIEIMSPSNKVGLGRENYLKKRQEILFSSAHLLEIDLLRAGQRLPVNGDLPPAAYYVFLSRADERPKVGIWPIQLPDLLPIVPVPLDKPDGDIPLDLQAAVSSIYVKSRYDFLIDYSKPPAGPFTNAESNFVRDVLAPAQRDLVGAHPLASSGVRT